MRFIPEGNHGQPGDHPWLAGCVQLDLGCSDNGKSCGSIFGSVTPKVAALVEAAPDLLEALQAYVDDARSQVSQGKPGSPFALRLVAGEAAIAKATK